MTLTSAEVPEVRSAVATDGRPRDASHPEAPHQMAAGAPSPETPDDSERQAVVAPNDGVSSWAPRRQLDRLRDALEECLAEPHAEAALLGVLNVQLIGMALRLQQTIDELLVAGEEPTRQLDVLLPAIDTLLKLTRQVDRFARLRIVLAETRDRLSDAKPRRIDS